MDKSYPHYHEDEPSHPHTKTSAGNYHGLKIEIKSNHPMANSYNYGLAVDGTEQRPVSQRAELSEVKNPSPRGKGKDHEKKPGTY